jgi:hypothetical protein
MRWLCLIGAALGVAACQPGEPDRMLMTYGSYASSPVVLLEVLVNGVPSAHGPVAYSKADIETPRTSDYNAVSYPPSLTSGQVVVSATWVEIFTAKAWTAEVTAPLSDLDYEGATDSVAMGPVFGPNGLMILTSDPVPKSATDIPTVDVARVCGDRVASLDADYTKDKENVFVTDILNFTYPPVTDPECPVQE